MPAAESDLYSIYKVCIYNDLCVFHIISLSPKHKPVSAALAGLKQTIKISSCQKGRVARNHNKRSLLFTDVGWPHPGLRSGVVTMLAQVRSPSSGGIQQTCIPIAVLCSTTGTVTKYGYWSIVPSEPKLVSALIPAALWPKIQFHRASVATW